MTGGIIQIVINIPRWVERIIVQPVLLYRYVRYGYAFRRIALTKGKFAIVDPDDYWRLSGYRWTASNSGRNWYALRREWCKDKKRNERCVYMHREVIKVPKGKFADHINHKTLDNRKANLRAATPAQNLWNRGKGRKKSTSKYKGVGWSKAHGKWWSQIQVNGKGRHLGWFKTEIEAARAYDAAAKKYHGEFALLNLE